MFCTRCGKENSEPAKFCFSCGSPTALANVASLGATVIATSGAGVAVDLVQSTPDAADSNIEFTFTGRARDILTVDGLKSLLQVISFVGIPWAWLRTLRWIAHNVSISNGTKASFTGTAAQIWGYVALFLFLSILNRLDLSGADMFKDAPWFFGIATVWWSVFLVGLTAYISLEFLRWLVRSTSLSSGDTVSFTGRFWPYLGWQTLTTLSIFTVIGWAWVTAAYLRWVCRNTTVSDYRGEFVGTGSQILWRTVVFILGCIPIVTIPAVVCWANRWTFSQFKGIPRDEPLNEAAPMTNDSAFRIRIQKDVINVAPFVVFVLVGTFLLGWAAVKGPPNSPIPGDSSPTLTSLSNLASENNRTLPMMIDSETELRNTLAVEGMFVYNYRLVNVSAANIDGSQLAAWLQPQRVQVLKAACSTPDTRDTFLKRGITLRYRYYDAERQHLADIDVKPADCGF